MAVDKRGKFKETDMKDEIKDHSRLLKPDMRIADFSKEQLTRMYASACECFYDSLEAWSKHVTLKYGFEAMIEAQHYHLVRDNVLTR